MQRLGKFFLLLLCALLSCLGLACDGVRYVPPSYRPTETFTVEYDYGNIEEGKATLLLSGNLPFFDFEEYGLTSLLAGEKLTVAYDGSMVGQDTYPGQIILKGSIHDVYRSNSVKIIEYLYDGELDPNDYPVHELFEYALQADGSILPLSKIEKGSRLFLALAYDKNKVTPSAVYTYHPLYPLSASEVTPWIADLSADQITEIEESCSYQSSDNQKFSEIKNTSDPAQIENILHALQNACYRQGAIDKTEIVEEQLVLYTLRTAEKEFFFTTYGNAYVGEESCYSVEGVFPTIPSEERILRFIPESSSCTLFVNGQKEKVYDESLKDYPFKRLYEEPVFPTTKRVLESDGYRLVLLDERRFLMNINGNEELFVLTGEKDFSPFLQA